MVCCFWGSPTWKNTFLHIPCLSTNCVLRESLCEAPGALGPCKIWRCTLWLSHQDFWTEICALLENGDALKFGRQCLCSSIQGESAGAGVPASLFSWRANTIRLVKKGKSVLWSTRRSHESHVQTEVTCRWVWDTADVSLTCHWNQTQSSLCIPHFCFHVHVLLQGLKLIF